MGIRDTYNTTNNQLVATVNEALQELGNARKQAVTLGGVDVDLPQAPESNVQADPLPTAPITARPDPIPSADLPNSSGSAKFPPSPGPVNTDRWGGPSRPTQSSKYLGFFGGTPDTPQEVIDRANAAVDAWVDAYFPALNECFKSEPEDWICDVISGVRPLGNSEEAIYVAWRAAKANEFNQLSSEHRTLYEEFSRRGFSLPPGVMVAQARRSQERFSDAVSTVNREAALKDVDVQVQLLQLAVQVAADLKRGMATVMAQYYNTIASLSDESARINNQRAQIVADAEARFTDSLTTYENINQQYYSAVGQLDLEGKRANLSRYETQSQNASREADFTLRNAELNLQAAQARLTAAIERSKAQGDIARTEASVYSTEVGAWSAKVSADVSVAQFEVERYKAEVAAALGKASSNSGAGTALSGAAQGFGAIGQAAASSQGSLVAQIETAAAGV